MDSYNELRQELRKTLAEGELRTQKAVEREKVRTAWKAGKLIIAHLLLYKDRADYGERVLKRLSNDLKISERELDYMVEFARTYPISPPAAKLSWSHYRTLLGVNDLEQRKSLAEQALHHKWTRETLRREVRKMRAGNPSAADVEENESIVPVRGILHAYPVVIAEAGKWKGRQVIDLGFSNYYLLPENSSYPEGKIVQVAAKDAGEAHSGAFDLTRDLSVKPGPEGLQPSGFKFTYQAYVLDVTDGDTLWVLIDLGLGVITKQHVRLRGIDAPEAASQDGAEAKRFVEKELAKCPDAPCPVVITSSKSDKYDRYLVDVFYQTLQGEKYLNNRLLEERLASRV